MKKPLNILLVNDDGYQSEGLRVLMRFAKTLGNVTVCAPKTEQSGKSHGINIVSPFEAKKVSEDGGCEVWYVDSTPADCVRFAVNGLHRDFDLVLSGINRGINVGRDILYSGTVGVIFEAKALGIPGIAVSTEFETFSYAEKNLSRVFAFLEENDLLAKNDLYNINIPTKEPLGIRVTRSVGPYYLDHIRPVEEMPDHYRQIGYSAYQGTKDLSCDLDAVMNGYISVTPMTIERTDFGTFGALNDLSVDF